MSRSIAISIMVFWTGLFAGLAHLAARGLSDAGSVQDTLFFGVLDSLNNHHLLIVLLLVVAVLFAWAAMSAAMGDEGDFRLVGSHAYAAAIFAMLVAQLAGMAADRMLLAIPAVLAASLAASAAACHWLPARAAQVEQDDVSRSLARRMALGAAHNSMLGRISGRPAPREV